MLAANLSPLLLVLLLACPLMMIFMMRGHGHGGGQSEGQAGGCHSGTLSGSETANDRPSLEELRARVEDLDAQIRAREAEDAERLTPAR